MLVVGLLVCGEGGGRLTVSGEVLDEDLHGLLGLSRGGAGGDAGDAVGTHGCVFG